MQANHDAQDSPGILADKFAANRKRDAAAVSYLKEAGWEVAIVWGVRNRGRGWAEESSGGVPRRPPRAKSRHPKLISPATPPPVLTRRRPRRLSFRHAPSLGTSVRTGLPWMQTGLGRRERTNRVPDRLSEQAALCRHAGVSPQTGCALLQPRENGSSSEPARGLPTTGRGSHPRRSGIHLR